MTTTQGTCGECNYNLPHHSIHCSQATPLHYLCAEHAPRHASKTDDQMTSVPCATCGTPTRKGY